MKARTSFAATAAHEIYRFKERTQVDAVFPALLLDRVIYAYIDIKKEK